MILVTDVLTPFMCGLAARPTIAVLPKPHAPHENIEFQLALLLTYSRC